MRHQSCRARDLERPDERHRRALRPPAVHARPHLRQALRAAMNGAAEGLAGGSITIVTQTRVRPEDQKAFAEWQDGTSRMIAGVPGFLHQTVMPPSPPAQI